MPKPCGLCVSPYRKEVIAAYKQRIPFKRIFEKYKPLMDLKSQGAFYITVTNHIKKGHVVESEMDKELTQVKKERVSLEHLVNKLTDMAAVKLDEMDPSDIKLRDVFAGHKVLIESKKLKLSQDAMEIALSKLFGPIIPGEIVEEEHGLLSSGRVEDGGSQPEDPQRSG